MCIDDSEKPEILAEAIARMNLARMSLFAGTTSQKVHGDNGGNAAALIVLNGDQIIHAEAAFSGSSSLPVQLKDMLAPSVSRSQFGEPAIAGDIIHANHTEPKLYESACQKGVLKNLTRITRIVLISERDCCKQCRDNTITDLKAMLDLATMCGGEIEFIVVETWSRSVRCAGEVLGL